MSTPEVDSFIPPLAWFFHAQKHWEEVKIIIKRYAIAASSAALLVSIVGISVLAAKPATNQAGAQKVTWNLSADVMPVPPYG